MKRILLSVFAAFAASQMFAATELNYSSNAIELPMWTKDLIVEVPCYTQVVKTTYRYITGITKTYWVDGIDYEDMDPYPSPIGGDAIAYASDSHGLSFDITSGVTAKLYNRDGDTFTKVAESHYEGTTNDLDTVYFEIEEDTVAFWLEHDYSYEYQDGYTTNVVKAALNDRKKIVATKQTATTIAVATESLIEVEQQYKNGFDTGIAALSAATNSKPNHGFTMGFKFPFPLSGTREALEGYIAKHEYDSANNCDILWLHLTKSLAGKQTWLVPFVSDSGMTTNRCTAEWTNPAYPGSSYTNVYSLTVGETEYDNIHKLYVPRPDEYQDFVVWYDPHMKWGRVDIGIVYDGIGHTAFGGELLYTGVLTDLVNSVTLTVEDGAVKSGWDYILSTNEVEVSDWWSTPDGKMTFNGATWGIENAGYTYTLVYYTDKYRLLQDDGAGGTRYFYSDVCPASTNVLEMAGYGTLTRVKNIAYGLEETNGKQYIEIPANVKVIDPSVLANYTNEVQHTICYATTPPLLSNVNSFSAAVLAKPLFVPYTALEAYGAASNWSSFTDIRAIPGTEPLPTPEEENSDEVQVLYSDEDD